MTIQDIIILVGKLLAQWLSEENQFTGSIVFTIHCRNGSIGKCSTSVNQDFSKNNIPLD